MVNLKEDLKEKIRSDIIKAKPNAPRKLNAEFKKIAGLISLTIGEPDFNQPELVKKSMIKAIKENDSHYSTARGNLAFRKAASNFLKRHFGLNYDPEKEIITTVGTTEAIFSSLSTILKDGDELLIPSPVYPLYGQAAYVNHAKVVYIPTNNSNFVLTPKKLLKALKNHPKAVGIVLTYPNNPTGVEYTFDQLKDLSHVIKKYNLFVLSDEIYSSFNYVGKHISIAKFIPEQTILVNGVSKSYAMTGARIGFAAAPADLISQIVKIHQYAITAVADVPMAGATKAFNDGDQEIDRMRQIYLKRRNYLIPQLKKIGFGVAAPDGAFYLFLKIPREQNQNDVDFARELAYKAKVGLTPGSYYGKGGEGYLRLSYAASDEKLHEAIERLSNYLK